MFGVIIGGVHGIILNGTWVPACALAYMSAILLLKRDRCAPALKCIGNWLIKKDYELLKILFKNCEIESKIRFYDQFVNIPLTLEEVPLRKI